MSCILCFSGKRAFYLPEPSNPNEVSDNPHTRYRSDIDTDMFEKVLPQSSNVPF